MSKPKIVNLTFTYEMEDAEDRSDEEVAALAADLLAGWLKDGNVPEVGVNAEVFSTYRSVLVRFLAANAGDVEAVLSASDLTHEGLIKDWAILPTEDARNVEAVQACIDFVKEWGEHLSAKEEWSMEDNFNVTEGLSDLYKEHFA